MRIGFFADCWEPQINGVITSIKSLESGLKENGHDVYKFIPDTGANGHPQNAVFRQAAIPYIFQKECTIADPLPYNALHRAREWQLDLVHAHSEFSLGLIAASVSRRLSLPFVFTLHTQWEHYAHYLFWGILPLNLLKRVMRQFYRMPDFFIAPSTKIKQYLEKTYRVSAPIRVIPTGIDLDRFRDNSLREEERAAFRLRYGLSPQDKVMILVGRLGKEKSLDLVLSSAGETMKKHRDLKILLVGGGPEKNELKRLSVSLGIQKSIVFTDYLPVEALPLAYKSSNFYVTASTTETQGLCSIEAAASGLPVVAIEDSAHRDIFGSNGNALFFQNGGELPHALDRLLTMPRLSEAMSARSIELSRRFTVEEFGRRVNEYYEWIMEENRKKRVRK